MLAGVDAGRALLAWQSYEGHPWEVAHNPGMPLEDDGSLTVAPS